MNSKVTNTKSYFFCGIGGSGMLPLASIIAAHGGTVAGSDRARDQGRSKAKFAWLEQQGMELFPQDGSGLHSGEQILVASAAVEDTVPDVKAANALGCRRITRAELLAELFNAAGQRIAIGGTSGKSTVTGMAGWIMQQAGTDPTIMNGAVMKNFASDDALFASARVGKGAPFVSEVDESDGSIALFEPDIAVLTNISLDHKTLDELHALFGDFADKASHVVWNHDDTESRALMASRDHKGAVSFGFEDGAGFQAVDVVEEPLSARFTLKTTDTTLPITLQVPGRHNIANALAAIAAAHCAGVDLETAVQAITTFSGLGRRFDIVGTANGITVIDDFGHNPEKIAATLRTVKAFPGRVIAFFQPHGFGPLRVMGQELAQMFMEELGADDHLIFCDPVYFGGTVDRSVGSADIIAAINSGPTATHIPDRTKCGEHIVGLAQSGDSILIMGARDDTLSGFARALMIKLEA
ncbi:glutamate ligase domain-containing protein [Alterisphingorhabdus coralli]|uniref:Mur ligase family protein n=1 Tax=Alterisphingorhabdus coralli TaxID=3071408 RepID=A0AA97I1X6_9SPHN|nr:Mur ligase family protein [Parasphingorhabdus sp. SCSIO 66989]WOE76562.1 Mur ligase family protein [Parasphingorhabdus sp. SCSIO 66989]